MAREASIVTRSDPTSAAIWVMPVTMALLFSGSNRASTRKELPVVFDPASRKSPAASML